LKVFFLKNLNHINLKKINEILTLQVGMQSFVPFNNNSNNLSIHAKEDQISIEMISQLGTEG
jgi:hypothetical protein